MKGQSPQAVLNRSGAEPLYAQIVQLLAQEIGERRLSPGTVLPSEAALCKRFGVARSVVRQALSVLAADGLIHREQGRPAVVAARSEHRRLVQRSIGLYDQFASAGTLLRTQVLRLERSVPTPEVAAFFASDDVWLLERLRWVDQMPIAFVRTWLPRNRFDGLDAEALEDASLHRVLAQQYGVRPVRGRNRIRAVGADTDLAAHLELKRGDPLLLLEGQSLDGDGRPMEWFTTWHRAEQLVFDVEVGPDAEQIEVAMQPQKHADLPPAANSDAKPLDQLEQMLGEALALLRRTRRQG